jgi:hypothetical protein
MRDRTDDAANYRLELPRGGNPLKKPNSIFWFGLVLYLASFFLASVGNMRGYMPAWIALAFPFGRPTALVSASDFSTRALGFFEWAWQFRIRRSGGCLLPAWEASLSGTENCSPLAVSIRPDFLSDEAAPCRLFPVLLGDAPGALLFVVGPNGECSLFVQACVRTLTRNSGESQ